MFKILTRPQRRDFAEDSPGTGRGLPAVSRSLFGILLSGRDGPPGRPTFSSTGMGTPRPFLFFRQILLHLLRREIHGAPGGHALPGRDGPPGCPTFSRQVRVLPGSSSFSVRYCSTCCGEKSTARPAVTPYPVGTDRRAVPLFPDRYGYSPALPLFPSDTAPPVAERNPRRARRVAPYL